MTFIGCAKAEKRFDFFCFMAILEPRYGSGRTISCLHHVSTRCAYLVISGFLPERTETGWGEIVLAWPVPMFFHQCREMPQ